MDDLGIQDSGRSQNFQMTHLVFSKRVTLKMHGNQQSCAKSLGLGNLELLTGA